MENISRDGIVSNGIDVNKRNMVGFWLLMNYDEDGYMDYDIDDEINHDDNDDHVVVDVDDDDDDDDVVLGLPAFFPLHFLGALKYKPPKCQGP